MQTIREKLKRNITALVLLGGLVLGIYACMCVYKGYESQTWPTTDGQITYSLVAGGTRIIGRKASVKYEYVVEGKRYVSPMISYTWKCVDYQGYLEILRDYPKGKNVIIYYNPQHPEQAVLKTDISKTILWLFLFSALTILIGARGLIRRPCSEEVDVES